MNSPADKDQELGSRSAGATIMADKERQDQVEGTESADDHRYGMMTVAAGSPGKRANGARSKRGKEQTT